MEITLDRTSSESSGWKTCLLHGMTTDPGHDCRICAAERSVARGPAA